MPTGPDSRRSAITIGAPETDPEAAADSLIHRRGEQRPTPATGGNVRARSEVFSLDPPPPAITPLPSTNDRDDEPTTRRSEQDRRLDAIIERSAMEDRARQRAMYYHSKGLDPVMAARAAVLGAHAHIPPDRALEVIDDLEDVVQSEEVQEFLQDAPRTREWYMENVVNAAQSKDDLGVLGRIEKLLSARHRFERNLTAGAGQMLGSHIAGTGRAWNHIGLILESWQRFIGADRMADMLFTPIPGTEDLPEGVLNVAEPTRLLIGTGEFIRDTAQSLGTPEEQRNFVDDVTTAIGQFGAQIGLTFTPIGRTKTQQVGFGFTQGVDIMDTLTEDDPVESELARAWAGLIGGAYTGLSQAPIIFKTIRPDIPSLRRNPTAWLRDRGEVFALEFLQESSQNLVYDLTRQYLTNPDVELDWAAAGYEGSVGGTAAAIVRSLLGIRSTAVRVSKATDDAGRLQELFELASESKLRGRSAESFQQFVDMLTDPDGVSPTHVYADGETLSQVFAQSELTDAQIDEALPSVREQLEAATQTGGTVAIPIGELLARIPGTPLEQALLPHLRSDADGLSFAEAQEVSAQVQELFQGAAEQITQQVEDSAVWTAQSQQVYDAVFNRLQELGRFTEDAHQAYASLVRDFYSVMAARTGHTPDSLFNRFPLTISAVAPSGAAPAAAPAPSTSPLSALPESILSSFPDLTVLESGLISLNQFTSDERAALERAGLVEERTTPEGVRYLAVDPEVLWAERKRRQDAAARARTGPAQAQIDEGLERRARSYEQRIAQEQAKGDLADEAMIEDLRARADATRARKGQPIEGLFPETRTDQQIETNFARQLETDPTAAVEQYAQLPETDGGRVLNVDIARELSPDYRADRTRAAAVHEPASAFIKRLYADRLSRPTPEGSRSAVLFTAGGTGAGKSTGLSLIETKGSVGQAEMIYDTNMANYTSAKAKVEQALAAGREVSIMYVYRDPMDSLVRGALPRAMSDGRTTPVEAFVEAHEGSRATVERLAAEYEGDPRVEITAVDNSRGMGNAEIVALADLPTISYDGLGGRLNEAIRQEAEAGRVSPQIARGFLGDRAPEVLPERREAVREEPQPTGEGLLTQRAPQNLPAAFRRLWRRLTDEEQQKRITQRTAEAIVSQLRALPSAREMAGVAWAGRAKRGWYAESARALHEVFGPDAPRFAALLAATSPQTSVESNLYNALSIWKNWTAAGRPTDQASIKRIMGESVIGRRGEDSVLPAWVNNTVRALSATEMDSVVLSGAKVNSFMRNLVGHVQEVTLDTWMASYAAVNQTLFAGALNVDGTDPGKRPGYVAMSVRVREAADQLTKLTGEQWTPAEVQETIWAWSKALYEMQESANEGRTAEQIVADGDLTYQLINAVPDFSGIFHDTAYARLLEEAGYGQQLEQLRDARGRDAVADEGVAAAEAEAAPFDAETQRRFELRAARRLTRVYQQRRENRAEPEPQFAQEIADQADGHKGKPGAAEITDGPATMDDFTAANIRGILRKDNWAIITSENPRAQQLGDAENAQRLAELRADLEAAGYQIKPTIGRYTEAGGKPENPFIVVGITEQQALELGRKYQQDSVLTRRGFVYEDGTYAPALGIEVHATRPDNFYTEIVGEDVFFTIDIDFNRRPLPDVERVAVLEQAPVQEPPSVGYHFSRMPRDVLDGRFYGTGMRGAEMKWVRYATDQRLKNRVYMYLDEGQGVKPESMVGRVAHTIDLSKFKMYDAQSDPDGFWNQADPETRESMLLDAGYDGYYVSGVFGTQGAAVILGDASHNVQAMQTDDVPLQQPLRQQARGTFDPQQLNITLLQNADLSTFLHETGHLFLEVMANIAQDADAPADVRADMDTVMQWFGVPDLQTWRAMTLDQQRAHHEKFAESFEQYLFEGKAPSTELQRVFRKFRTWLISVYRSLTGFMSQSNASLTPEVRQVFDRMLATQEQLELNRQIQDAGILFQDAESASQAGMTDNQYQQYHQLGEDAAAQAQEQLERRSLRDLQWLDNARSKVLKRLQAQHKDLRRAVREEVVEEVRQDPTYAAWRWLRTGELPDGTKTEGAKLSTEALREMYGTEPNAAWRWLPTNILRAGREAEGGMHPDMVAEMFGFDSGDALVRSILHAPPETQQIEARVDERMMQEHAELATPEAMQHAANEAIHNDARARMVATELKALREGMGARARTPSGGSVNVMIQAAKQYAQEMITRRKVSDLRPGEFTRAEARSMREAERAMAAGDTMAAIRAKRNQLLNHHLAKATLDAQERVRKGVTYLRKFENQSTRRNLDNDYLDQIDAILEKLDLRRSTTLREIQRREALSEWVEKQREMGLEPLVDEALIERAQLRSYKQLTMEEFDSIIDSVRNIEHLGRLKDRLLKAQDKRQFDTIVTDLAASIEDNARKVVPEQLEVTRVDRVLNAFNDFIAMHRKLSSLARQMDGDRDGGPMWELLVRPLNEAMDTEASMRERATRELIQIMSPVLRRGYMKQKEFIPEINASLTKQARMAVALNIGNETNMQRLMDGDGWTAEQIDAIIRTLSTQDLHVVQQAWDFIDTYWADIAAKEKRVSGVAPQKVEATPITVISKDGDTVDLRGGYYPIKYDIRRDTRSAAQEADTIAQQMRGGLFTRATTRRGHTKARAQKVSRPIRKDMGVMFEHIEQVIHDLTMHEYLIDANRLMRDKRIDQSIRRHYGPEIAQTIRDALRDVAVGNIPAVNAWESFLNHVRAGVSIAGMGWNLMTASVQVLGLTQSIQRIGPRWVAQGAAHWVGDATRMESTLRKIQEKSEFMRLRARALNREVSEVRNRVAADQTATRQAIESSFFWLLLRVQFFADVPTWQGMYLKQLAHGADEATAVALADQAVRDTQGSGMLGDMSAMQRGGPMMKLWTNFYNFFNTTFNLMAESVARTDFKNPMSVGRMAADMFLLIVFPAFLSSLLYEVALGDPDDFDPEEFAERVLRDQMSYLMGTMVGVRDLSGVVTGFDYSGPSGLRFYSAMERAIRQATKDEPDEAAIRAAIDTAGILFHFPSTQVNRVWMGTKAVIEEDAPIKSMLYGPPRD